MSALAIAPAPAPAFVKGDAVVYSDGQGARWETTVRRVVRIPLHAEPKRFERWYVLEGAPGVTVHGSTLVAA